MMLSASARSVTRIQPCVASTSATLALTAAHCCGVGCSTPCTVTARAKARGRYCALFTVLRAKVPHPAVPKAINVINATNKPRFMGCLSRVVFSSGRHRYEDETTNISRSGEWASDSLTNVIPERFSLQLTNWGHVRALVLGGCLKVGPWGMRTCATFQPHTEPGDETITHENTKHDRCGHGSRFSRH